MKIEITHNINDISTQVIEDAQKVLDKRIADEITRLSSFLNTAAQNLVEELTEVLEIKDTRQRERVKRAVVKNLDRWTKGGIK